MIQQRSTMRACGVSWEGTDPLRASGSFGEAEIALGNIYNYSNFWYLVICSTEQRCVIPMDSYERAHESIKRIWGEGGQAGRPRVLFHWFRQWQRCWAGVLQHREFRR